MFILQAQNRKKVHSDPFIYDLYTRLTLENARRVLLQDIKLPQRYQRFYYLTSVNDLKPHLLEFSSLCSSFEMCYYSAEGNKATSIKQNSTQHKRKVNQAIN